jgi:hypothetical protein
MIATAVGMEYRELIDRIVCSARGRVEFQPSQIVPEALSSSSILV